VIRAFVAVTIDAKTVKNITDAMSQLKERVPGVRWAAKENLHLTLKFLGWIDEARIEPITRALEQAVRPFSRFTINAKGLGVFPDLKLPRVLWLALESKDLVSLASVVESALEPLGFMPEKRSFKPHLTVGRWRQFEGSAARLREELEKWQTYKFGQSQVEEVILFQSMLKPEGAVYHSLKSVALAN
jgi:RNA 2',3'-cyclic 3'-phosphodiesterase